MTLSWMRLPFRYRNLQDYKAKLADFVSEAFYERLPAQGYEVREEQIFTAYRMAGALTNRRVLLAEAATGTGKTFAYLIGAVCHARLSGAPVVIACASSVLHQQLAGPNGDIATLSRLLGLEIDARVARDPADHLCELKAEALTLGGIRRRGLTRLLRWAETSQTGERGEIPDAPDDLWNLVAWEPSLPCDTCRRRGHCRLARAREHYRQAPDLLICSHDLFFRDLWSRKERLATGRIPILPKYSGVILDEGHHTLETALLTSGHRIGQQDLQRIITQADSLVDRKGLMHAARSATEAAGRFWSILQTTARPSETERWFLPRITQVTEAARELSAALIAVQEELAWEEDRLRATSGEIWAQTIQAHFDAIMAGLTLFLEHPCITWLTRQESGAHCDLWVVPRQMQNLLQQELFSQRIPVVLTSATLAGGHSFAYQKRMLGVPSAEHSLAGTPFDLARQVLVYLPSDQTTPGERLVPLLRATGGRALVLVNSRREREEVKQLLDAARMPFPVYYEGEADQSELLRRFRERTSSVLVGTRYWEGIDVPGESLSCVAVYRLPFPLSDPLVFARREDAAHDQLDPFLTVDVPEMLLRLKQGLGRLVRTRSDSGVLAVLDTQFVGSLYAERVAQVFPADAAKTDDLHAV
ncbi:MAG: ATP-dependent DNA helicase, partial [Bacillota bacterium]